MDVDFDTHAANVPLFKKYGVMNSGLLDAQRYNQTIFDSLAVARARCYFSKLLLSNLRSLKLQTFIKNFKY